MRNAALFLLCALLPAGAQTITSLQGVSPYQVFQRDEAGVALVRVSGTAQGADGKTVELSQGPAAASTVVQRGAWSAELRGVPTGGPYDLRARIAGTPDVRVVGNILVGDLWILAGQSNMEGVGNLQATPLPSNLVNMLDMTDVWGMARDPLHRLPDATDRVHWRTKDAQGNPRRLEGAELAQWIANRKKGAGVGLPFALEMVRRTGVPVGLVPCAHGGTSMDQWSPALKERGGDSLYGAMLRRFKLSGGRVKGVLWYQGESDANPKAAPLFEEKFKSFVEAVRADFAQPALPFYYVQIGRHVSAADARVWNQVQDAQRRLEAVIPNSGMVTCADCSLDDGIHVGTDDFRLLGRRMALLACHDLYPAGEGCAAVQRGPRPVAAKFAGGMVHVEFSHVNGRLRHEGRLSGFSIHDAQGNPAPVIYRQRVSAAHPNVVELLIGGKMPEGAVLHYGAGRDPFVNLRDEAGMAAPVFGPLPIGMN